jgi:hypothetical protein
MNVNHIKYLRPFRLCLSKSLPRECRAHLLWNIPFWGVGQITRQRYLTLQRYLTRCRLPSPFSVRQKGTVVALLSPCYQVEDVRNRQGF